MKKSTAIDTREVLKQHGFKHTVVREALLRALAATTSPVTVGELAHTLAPQRADTATIYRALKAFVDVGIVHTLSLHKDKISYELVRAHHDHHIICNTCGIIESVPICIGTLSAKIKKMTRQFSTVTTHRLEFFGTCKKCVHEIP